jgi:hypothetical protein
MLIGLETNEILERMSTRESFTVKVKSKSRLCLSHSILGFVRVSCFFLFALLF